MLRTATLAGLKIHEFWDMTPRELTIFIDSSVEHRKERITLTWLGAAWQRAKKMPPLHSIIGTKKKEQSPKQILETVKALNKKFGGKVIE